MGCGGSTLKGDSSYDHLNSPTARKVSNPSQQQQEQAPELHHSNFNTRPMDDYDFPNRTSATATLWAQGVSPLAATAQAKPLFGSNQQATEAERRKSDAQIDAFLDSKRTPRNSSSAAAAQSSGVDQQDRKKSSRFSLGLQKPKRPQMTDEEYVRHTGMTREEIQQWGDQRYGKDARNAKPGSWGGQGNTPGSGVALGMMSSNFAVAGY